MRSAYEIPKPKRKSIILEALNLAYYKEVDELDCSKSFARQPTNKSIDEVLKIAFTDKKALYNFIFRKMDYFGEEDYFDVGFSTLGTEPNYFLWLKLTPEDGFKLIEKYKLVPIV